MKLSKFNRFLRSPVKAEAGLWISAKTSSAVEGIRQPFTNDRRVLNLASRQAFIEYWKKQSSGSGR